MLKHGGTQFGKENPNWIFGKKKARMLHASLTPSLLLLSSTTVCGFISSGNLQ
jgi:hypothetical protein